MNLSGIFVATRPEWLTTVKAALEALPGVEVHQVDAATGRIVVVQEAADIHAEIEGVRRIQALPHVVMAEMVYHYIADDPLVYDGLPPELASRDGETSAIPADLRD
ncbi:MAG: chaperone NapD [Thiobacillaceae bacterium]